MDLPIRLTFLTNHSLTSLSNPTSLGYLMFSGNTVASTSIPFALMILRSINSLYVFSSSVLKNSNPKRSRCLVSVLESNMSSVSKCSKPQNACMYGFSKTSFTNPASNSPDICDKSSNPMISCTSVAGRPRSEKCFAYSSSSSSQGLRLEFVPK
jgi:hypothetical protein